MTNSANPRTPYGAFALRARTAALQTGTKCTLRITDAALSLSADAPMTFCDLGPLPLTCSREDFSALLRQLTQALPCGSSFAFEYSEEDWPYAEMERFLSRRGCLIYEHLSDGEILEQFLVQVASCRPKPHIRRRCYCLAVKHRDTP